MNASTPNPSLARRVGWPEPSAYAAARSGGILLQETGRTDRSNQFRAGNLLAVRSRGGLRTDPIANLLCSVFRNQAQPREREQVALHRAVALYAEGTATLGQAAAAGGISQAEFQLELGRRRVPVHYDLDDLRDDLEAVATWPR